MSLQVPESQAAQVSSDLQTTQGKEDAKVAEAAKATDPAKRDVDNMEAQAELTRKSEDTDDDWTDASECSDKKDLNEVQQAETGDKPNEKSRVRRREKKGMKEQKPRQQKRRQGKVNGQRSTKNLLSWDMHNRPPKQAKNSLRQVWLEV